MAVGDDLTSSGADGFKMSFAMLFPLVFSKKKKLDAFIAVL